MSRVWSGLVWWLEREGGRGAPSASGRGVSAMMRMWPYTRRPHPHPSTSASVTNTATKGAVPEAVPKNPKGVLCPPPVLTHPPWTLLRAPACATPVRSTPECSPSTRATPQSNKKSKLSAADKQLKKDEAIAKKEARKRLPKRSEWKELGGRDLEPILASMTLIRVSWLIKLVRGEVMPEREGVIPPWQQLPPEAKVSLQELREAATGEGDYLPLGILSYGWESKAHPDPHGHLLRRLLPFLISMDSGDDDFRRIIAIAWDFPSFPQRGYTLGYDPAQDDRTEYEQKRFGRGLSNINIPYAHPFVTVLVCDFDMPAGAENTHSIWVRGWCIFERCLSVVAKNSPCYLHLSKVPEGAEDMSWPDVVGYCMAARKPPMAGDAFEKMMLEGMASGDIIFSYHEDSKKVAVPQYQQGLLRLLGTQELLIYSMVGWGAAEAEQLVRAFVYAQSMGTAVAADGLDISSNELGSEGVRTIGRAIEAGLLPRLERLDIESNGADAETVGWIKRVAEAAGCTEVDV